MLLTHEKILEAHKKGDVIIEPFNPDLVSINSVDVRLGLDLWKLDTEVNWRDIYNVQDDDWTKVTPITAKEVRVNHPGWAEGIVDDDTLCFVLKSGAFYLATTLECIGTAKARIVRPYGGLAEQLPCLIPQMKAKSTVGRQGLTVALCAGLGDVGYASKWALEVRVVDCGDVPIAVGTPIGQVTFEEGYYTKASYDGPDRYQDGTNIRFLPKGLKVVL